MRTDAEPIESSLTSARGASQPAEIRRVRCVIVGAGPHALTIAAHLVADDRSLADDLVVIDPNGGWMRAWRRAFAAFEIEHLRSPVVHHPHPDPYGLLVFARAHGRSRELHGRYQAPGTRLFDDYCDHVVDEFALGDAVVRGTVTAVGADGLVTYRTELDRRTEQVYGDRVVCAHHPRRPVTPDIGMPTRVGGLHCHAADVDLDEVGAGEHVVVVGGGLTAGHLACAAVRRGATVDVVVRRPVVEREFDTDPGWLGPREMRAYLGTECLDTRARLAVEARGGGSMPAWMLSRLRELGAAGRVRVRCRAGDELLAETTTDAHHVWYATGWATDPLGDPALGRLVESIGCRTVGDLLVLGPRLELGGTAVHVVGRPAALHLGPTAGNLAGARRAAALLVGRDPDETC